MRKIVFLAAVFPIILVGCGNNELQNCLAQGYTQEQCGQIAAQRAAGGHGDNGALWGLGGYLLGRMRSGFSGSSHPATVINQYHSQPPVGQPSASTPAPAPKPMVNNFGGSPRLSTTAASAAPDKPAFTNRFGSVPSRVTGSSSVRSSSFSSASRSSSFSSRR